MGGCRCTFRTCTVNTQKFPGMHFFHYPLRHQARLEKWVEYADFSKLYDMSSAQAKNKVVCALHFRDECFMNYKKDRLIPQAIPTLTRLKNGLVLDHSLSDKPRPFALSPTKEKHLIPPEGYDPLGIHEDYFVDATVEMIECDDDVFKQEAKRPRISKVVTMSPKILNKGVRFPSTSSLNGNLNEDDLSTITLSDEVIEGDDYGIVEPCNDGQSIESLSNEAQVTVDELINLADLEILPSEKEECTEIENMVSRALYEQMVDAFESDIFELKQAAENKERQAEERIAQLEQELEASNKAHQSALEDAEAAKQKSMELQKKLLANQELAKVAEMPKQKSVGSAPIPLSKAQLFNGIKKYLTASMTSLVRMEMFGGAERQWKPDEKQVCIELLRLGAKVYKYFTDEWRFRLPSTTLVESWTNEVTEEDEEDL